MHIIYYILLDILNTLMVYIIKLDALIDNKRRLMNKNLKWKNKKKHDLSDLNQIKKSKIWQSNFQILRDFWILHF